MQKGFRAYTASSTLHAEWRLRVKSASSARQHGVAITTKRAAILSQVLCLSCARAAMGRDRSGVLQARRSDRMQEVWWGLFRLEEPTPDPAALYKVVCGFGRIGGPLKTPSRKLCKTKAGSQQKNQPHPVPGRFQEHKGAFSGLPMRAALE